MFKGLQEWHTSTAAWRLVAIAFADFLRQRRDGGPPRMTAALREEVLRRLHSGHLVFFEALIDELERLSVYPAFSNAWSIRLIHEAAASYPQPPRFSPTMNDQLFSIELGL